jgi:hypothetical protein
VQDLVCLATEFLASIFQKNGLTKKLWSSVVLYNSILLTNVNVYQIHFWRTMSLSFSHQGPTNLSVTQPL